MKFLLVCPVYTVSVQACQFVCPRSRAFCQGSVVLALVVSGWCYLFAVRFSSLFFFNRFVINAVSLPVYVKESHFCVAVSVHLKWWWDVCGCVFCVCGQGNHCLT